MPYYGDVADVWKTEPWRAPVSHKMCCCPSCVRRIENPGNFGSEGTMHRLREDDKQLINLSKSSHSKSTS